ncbi:MAG: hypothetical protein FJY39_12515, partial [Betaproteobacteria bacterium]|nr:hypothetical protein [Betaproteobacteria bacterium]
MQAIARAPDYMRLGPSRTPDSGAPMVFAVGDDLRAIPEASLGRSDVAVMADGQRVPFRYAVVRADAVQASHRLDGAMNAGFALATPGVLKALNNGRIAGLRGAYDQGSAAIYQAELVADAASHGVDPAAIALTPNPILVRIYSEASNTRDMAEKSQGQGLGMSAPELARQDAKLMDSRVLAAYREGDVSNADNRDFVRAFVGRVAAAGQDVATFVTAQGHLSPVGRTRIQAALAQAAYDDSDLIAEMFDALDTEIKGIGEALKQVAGHWANMRDSARLGLIDPKHDITVDLMDTVGLIKRARQERRSFEELLRQPDLQTASVPNPVVQALARVFYTGPYLSRAVSKEKTAARLKTYVDHAMATRADPGLFGDPPTALDTLSAVLVPHEAAQALAADDIAATESRIYQVNQPRAGYDMPGDLFPETLAGLQPTPGRMAPKPRPQPSGGAGAARATTTATTATPAPAVTGSSATPSMATAALVPAAPPKPMLALRPDPFLPGIYHYASQLVQVGERTLPFARIQTWQEASSALAALGQYAVEHLDVLITDAAGKPLAVVGSFKGGPAQAAVYPNTLLAEALRIEGAARAWAVHNHPSGQERLSGADQALSRSLSEVFAPSSVSFMGVAAVGAKRFQAVDGRGNLTEGDLVGGTAAVTVPIAERTIVRNNALMPQVSNAQHAHSVMAQIAPKNTPGVLFTDAQQKVTAFVPIDPAQARQLRTDQRFDRLINAAAQAGALYAFVASPNQALDRAAVGNLAAALRKLEVEVLDVVDVTQPATWTQSGIAFGPAANVFDLGRAKAARRIDAALAGYGTADRPTPRVHAGQKLAKLLARLDAGALSPEAFEAQVRTLAGALEDATQAKAEQRARAERSRGVDQVRERLIRARRQGDLDPATVEFALWALAKNPALATNLGISIVAPQGDGAAGSYNPTLEVMRLFKGADARDTAVHELLHHAERMMPASMQDALRSAWASAYSRALETASPEERAALLLVPQAMLGERSAHEALRQAILEGPLNYDDHYALVNPSEYWAVHAAALLGRRFEADGAVFKRIAVWFQELLERAKDLLGLDSDAAILRALERLLDPAATSGVPSAFQSPRMLADLRTAAPSSLVQPQVPGPNLYADLGRDSLGAPPPQPTPPNRSRWQAAKTRALSLTSPESIDALLYAFQDKLIDLKRVQQRIAALGGVVTDLNN